MRRSTRLEGRIRPALLFALDTAAFAFLQTDAPQCAAADIGVILRSWWLGMDAKARVRCTWRGAPFFVEQIFNGTMLVVAVGLAV